MTHYVFEIEIKSALTSSRSVTSVLQDERGDDSVPVCIPGVQQNQNQVETAQQRAGQGHIDGERLVGVVLAFRVGGCQDGGPGVQLTYHSGEDRTQDLQLGSEGSWSSCR